MSDGEMARQEEAQALKIIVWSILGFGVLLTIVLGLIGLCLWVESTVGISLSEALWMGLWTTFAICFSAEYLLLILFFFSLPAGTT